jgi:hypothetical protein
MRFKSMAKIEFRVLQRRKYGLNIKSVANVKVVQKHTDPYYLPIYKKSDSS